MKRSWDLTQCKVLRVGPAGLVLCHSGVGKSSSLGLGVADTDTIPWSPGAQQPASPGTPCSLFFLISPPVPKSSGRIRAGSPPFRLHRLLLLLLFWDPSPFFLPASSSLILCTEAVTEAPEAWLSSSSSAFHSAKATKARKCKKIWLCSWNKQRGKNLGKASQYIDNIIMRLITEKPLSRWKVGAAATTCFYPVPRQDGSAAVLPHGAGLPKAH